MDLFGLDLSQQIEGDMTRTVIDGDYGLVVVSREGYNTEKFIYESDLLTRYRSNIIIVTEWIVIMIPSIPTLACRSI
jgi:hypothetical protein